MSPARLPAGRITALAAVVVGIVVITQSTAAPRFRTLAPGIEFATLRGEPYCRRGSSMIAVVRLDPERTRFRVRHYSREPDRRPLNIVEWQRRTGAHLIFNAGQYYPDFSYMGLLVSGGEVVSERLHPRFQAALVAAPVDGGREVRVLDLADEAIDIQALGWREVAQSFMLFDRTGTIRTRKSNLIANRTVVGEDRHGRVLVVTSEGGYTLYDFAELLRNVPLHLTHAMSMDGGSEAEMCVRVETFRYASFGPWDESGVAEDSPGAQVSLPAVVAVIAE